MIDEIRDQAAHVSLADPFSANNMLNFYFHLPTSGTIRV